MTKKGLNIRLLYILSSFDNYRLLLSIYLYPQFSYYCTITITVTIKTAAPQLCARGPLLETLTMLFVFTHFSKFFSECINIVNCFN